jgi:uncharacterized surface protein with fasciclin (FAS1) repeats
MKNNRTHIKNLAAFAICICSFALVQCDFVPEPDTVKKDIKEMQILQYIEADTTDFIEFFNITEKVNLSGILSTRGPFTLFLPNDEAFKAYYQLKGKSSYNDFTNEELAALIKNHVIAARIPTTDFGFGSIRERNAIGDYLVSEFEETDIIINKYAKVIRRDINVANGIIHKIDMVIDPVVDGTFETIKDLDYFSIFTKGLEMAGLKDTLDMVSIPYGNTTARVRYTILAVPDSVFNANNIFSVEDLVARYDDGLGGLTQDGNGFFEYMAYHCLENTYYLSDFEHRNIYFIITRNNNVYFEVGAQFSINPSTAAGAEVTTFIDKYSNIPTKNGVIHCINQLLPAQESVPREFRFDTTAFPEFMELEGYGEDLVRNFYDGENGFAKVKWTGDYLQYWCKHQGTGFINEDCITMSEGFWTLEITMPRVPRGKYEMYGFFKRGYNRANIIMYLDGERIDQVIELNSSNMDFVNVHITNVDWSTTQEHVVKLVTVYPGVIMWDRLSFVPIVE